MKAGHKQSEIAMVLGRSKSTISRELKRNRGLRGYRPRQVQRMSKERRKAKVKPRLDPAVWGWALRLLREDLSPEQISLWLAREKKLSVVVNCFWTLC